jgi:hypothetical protein
MKLSRAGWWILVLGVFLVAVFSLGLARSQQVKAQGQLSEELKLSETRLGKLQIRELQQQREELKHQVDEARVQLAAAKDKMRATVESIDVTDHFYAVAKSCGVTVVSIGSSAVGGEKLAGIGCSVIVINATVGGDTHNLVDFILSLNSDFATGVVRSAQVTMPEGKTPLANIRMFVYAYEGS